MTGSLHDPGMARRPTEAGRTNPMKVLSKGFGFRLGDRRAVVISDLSIRPGAITVLMGDSGVGKSTMCNAIVRVRPGDAMVYQDSGGLQHLTVRENLSLAVSGIRGRPDRSDGKCPVRESERRFGLNGGTTAGDLSGGERRRLAVACALVSEPAVVWLDEPDSGLDRNRVEQLASLLREAANRESRPAIVVVTHDPQFVALLRPALIVEIVRGRAAGTGMWALRLQRASLGAHELHTGADVLSILERLDDEAAEGDDDVPTGAHAESRDGPAGERSGPVRWMALAVRTLSAMALPLYDGIARRTLATTLSMTTWASAPYYLVVGAATGVVLVITLLLIPGVTEIWYWDALVAEVSPHLLVRAAPAVAAVLIAASTGSLVASWVGQMQARRELDALRVLAADVDRRVLAPAVIGLAGGALFGTLLFAAGMTASFLVFASTGPAAGAGGIEAFAYNLGDLWTGLPLLQADVASNPVLAAAGEALLFAAILSVTAVNAATSPSVSSQEAVAHAVRHAIVRATVCVIVLKTLILTPNIARW